MNIKTGLTFDDVLLVPKHSTVKSRKLVDLTSDLGKGVCLGIPIISANMKNVTGPAMCAELLKFGGMPIMHRFYDSFPAQIQDLKNAISANKKPYNTIGVSVGIGDVSGLVDELISAGAKIICIDIAHGDHSECLTTIGCIKKLHPNVLLIAGNVATASGAQNLYDAGADVVKCGIGGGSLCTTRVETGNGMPQLTALEDVYEQSGRGKKFKVIADGGIRTAGDVVKALCFSHAVMIGNVLAGTDEAPGETITADGKVYKTYAGSSTHKINHIEGITGLVPSKGPVAKVIEHLLDGIRSGCSYQGAHDLEELRKNPEFVSISNAGLVESKPHDIIVIR